LIGAGGRFEYVLYYPICQAQAESVVDETGWKRGVLIREGKAGIIRMNPSMADETPLSLVNSTTPSRDQSNWPTNNDLPPS